MYVQPFFLGTLALGWARLRRLRWLAAAPLVAFAYLAARTQHSYAVQSFGKYIMVEQKTASEDALFRRMRAQIEASPAEHFIIATDSSFIAKVATMCNGGRSMRIPVFPFLPHMAHTGANWCLPPEEEQRFQILANDIHRPFRHRLFQMYDPRDPQSTNRFVTTAESGRERSGDVAVVYGSGRLTLLNRFRLPETGPRGMLLAPLAELNNHLILIDSSLGHQYYVAGGRANVSMYQLERDFFYPDR